MSEANIGAGDIEIELDGKPYTMRPTLKAALALSNVQGGISMMVQRCLNCELDAIVSVISHGLGATSKDLPELVYKTGMLNLNAQCIRFLHVISNGGRPPVEKEDDSEDFLSKTD